jgi:hypothetical protein
MRNEAMAQYLKRAFYVSFPDILDIGRRVASLREFFQIF